MSFRLSSNHFLSLFFPTSKDLPFQSLSLSPQTTNNQKKHNYTADLKLSIMQLPSTPHSMDSTSFQPHLLSSYPPSEIARYIKASPPMTEWPCRTYLLSSNLVAKQIDAEKVGDELAAINLARQLHIRAPNVKRVVQDGNLAYVIMDRIHGVGLEECWGRIGWMDSLRLAVQLRRYVRAMRTCTSPTAGSLVRGACDSIWLDDYYKLPPLAAPEAITRFFRFWLEFTPGRRRKGSGIRTPLIIIAAADLCHLLQRHWFSPIRTSRRGT